MRYLLACSIVYCLCNSFKTYRTLLLQSEMLKLEFQELKQKYHSANEEITNLRLTLEESRSNGDRLHKESELVVQNVNTWVKEQK